MALRLTTLRARMLLGSGALIAGIVATAGLALSSLSALRRAVTDESALLSQVSVLSSGILAAAFDEVRAAELYLVAPTTPIRHHGAVGGSRSSAANDANMTNAHGSMRST